MIDTGAEITLVNIEALDPDMGARTLNYCNSQMWFTKTFLVARNEPTHEFHGTFFRESLVNQIDVDHVFLDVVIPMIRTEFVMMVQNDGFMIGAKNWSADFLKYDYIAAPWKPDFPSCNRVGCGAFTLQSQRFLRAQRKHRHLYPSAIETPHKGLDYWVSHTMHPIFTMQEGIQYAPLDMACRWALEYEIPEVPYTDEGKVGFHKFTTPQREVYKQLL